MKIQQQVQINGKIAKNRIVMPPLVCFNWADDNGNATINRAEHYGKRAKGTGLIVIEATAVSKAGRLCESELGLWKDEQISQFTEIAESCHQHDALAVLQLVHAGFNGITHPVFSASSDTKEGKVVKALSLEAIEQVKNDFVSAAIRAEKAGLDGIEIHGAHTYLLNQFTSQTTNKRNDRYGGTLENRLRLPLEITREIRKYTSKEFIVGYRFGVNDPSFTEDITLLKSLDSAGIDFFNVSIGFSSLAIDMPKNFPFHPITYMGVKLSQHTEKPVIAVYGIRTPEQAKLLIEQYQVPMVAIGRGLLADPEWSEKALQNKPVNRCFECKPKCKFSTDGRECPALKIQEKQS